MVQALFYQAAWKTSKTKVYNYLYSKEELKPWADKIKQISTQSTVVRGYFNNHYGARPARPLCDH
jgi:uncharacterized protein YecE (DUF72 family)